MTNEINPEAGPPGLRFTWTVRELYSDDGPDFSYSATTVAPTGATRTELLDDIGRMIGANRAREAESTVARVQALCDQTPCSKRHVPGICWPCDCRAALAGE